MRKSGIITKGNDEIMPLTWAENVLVNKETPLTEVLIEAPQEAEVGQILAVKTVDENGKPTEWEVIKNAAGSKDYEELENLPSINGVTLEGDKTADDLGLLTEEQYKGAYTKPDDGIPKSDLNSAVQTSLGKADTALQEHQSLEDYVKTNDSRLTDARASNDVQSYAKTGSGITVGVSVPSNAKFTDTTYSAATTSASGLMSAADKTKLNGIATGANAYSLPNATSSVLGGVKIGSNISVSSGTISLSKNNITNALGYTPEKEGSGSAFVKSGNILGASSNIPLYYDKSKCSVYRYVNTNTKEVYFDVAFVAGSKNIAAGSSATFANVPDYLPSAVKREYIITADYVMEVRINLNGALSVHVVRGTVPSGTSINVRIEWHYV